MGADRSTRRARKVLVNLSEVSVEGGHRSRGGPEEKLPLGLRDPFQ